MQPETAVSVEPLLLSEREAARVLGNLCQKTLFNLRQRGLPYIKVGTRVMYRPRDLERWIEQRDGSNGR